MHLLVEDTCSTRVALQFLPCICHASPDRVIGYTCLSDRRAIFKQGLNPTCFVSSHRTIRNHLLSYACRVLQGKHTIVTRSCMLQLT
jgi:hypothetical protein